MVLFGRGNLKIFISDEYNEKNMGVEFWWLLGNWMPAKKTETGQWDKKTKYIIPEDKEKNVSGGRDGDGNPFNCYWSVYKNEERF